MKTLRKRTQALEEEKEEMGNQGGKTETLPTTGRSRKGGEEDKEEEEEEGEEEAIEEEVEVEEVEEEETEGEE